MTVCDFLRADPDVIRALGQETSALAMAALDDIERIWGQYESMGENWSDAWYRDVGLRLSGAVTRVRRACGDLTDQARHLSDLAVRLESLRQTELGYAPTTSTMGRPRSSTDSNGARSLVGGDPPASPAQRLAQSPPGQSHQKHHDIRAYGASA